MLLSLPVMLIVIVVALPFSEVIVNTCINIRVHMMQLVQLSNSLPLKPFNLRPAMCSRIHDNQATDGRLRIMATHGLLMSDSKLGCESSL